ncbi:hypothetical protein V8E53_008992 [Lactarius tabidus]
MLRVICLFIDTCTMLRHGGGASLIPCFYFSRKRHIYINRIALAREQFSLPSFRQRHRKDATWFPRYQWIASKRVSSFSLPSPPVRG